MSHFISFLIGFLLIVVQVFSLNNDYYWRKYTGTIPADAFTAGKDINGKDTYIGQAYVRGHGLIVAQIYPGVKEVYSPIHGLHKLTEHIKILCGPQKNFRWIPAKANDLHLTMIGKNGVIGGHEDCCGHMSIGRIYQNNEVKIGKINSFNVGDSLFYFNDNGTEGRNVRSYEVLTYIDSNSVREE